MYDIRDIEAEPIAMGREGSNAWAVWYRVRSNLTHRGKASDRDFGLVIASHLGMHDVLRLLLLDMQPELADEWRATDPDEESAEWMLWRGREDLWRARLV